MEITCNRCHQTVPAESTYCAACGLPQLVYSTDGAEAPADAERWTQAVRDASEVEWRPALRLAVILALPAAILFCVLVPPLLCFFWAAAVAAIVVALYSRTRRPAWITLGAGARIGLVTGLVTGWTVFGITGAGFFASRTLFHQGPSIDEWWRGIANQAQQQFNSGGDPQQLAAASSLIHSPEGLCAVLLTMLVFFESLLVLFSVAGGALGARMMIRRNQR